MRSTVWLIALHRSIDRSGLLLLLTVKRAHTTALVPLPIARVCPHACAAVYPSIHPSIVSSDLVGSRYDAMRYAGCNASVLSLLDFDALHE